MMSYRSISPDNQTSKTELVDNKFSFNHEHPNFYNFIRGLLAKTELSNAYVQVLLDSDSMREFTKAFTHKTIDPIHNYEYYETLGDVTTNKIVVWYYHRRFPQLFDNPGGGNMGPVAIMARLKQVGISKKTYSQFASGLGFWEYIRANEEIKKSKLRLLEDTFESFIGCLEYLIDMKIMQHNGYRVVYEFMKKIMDKMEISLDREELYDHKTKLNEDINFFKGRLKLEYQSIDNSIGKPQFLENKDNVKVRFESRVIITDSLTGQKYRSKCAFGPNKSTSEQLAADLVRKSGFLTNFSQSVQ